MTSHRKLIWSYFFTFLSASEYMSYGVHPKWFYIRDFSIWLQIQGLRVWILPSHMIFMEIDHEIFCTVILPLQLIQEGICQLLTKVYGEHILSAIHSFRWSELRINLIPCCFKVKMYSWGIWLTRRPLLLHLRKEVFIPTEKNLCEHT